MSFLHLNIKSSKTERDSRTFLAADEDWCLTAGLAVHCNKQPDGTFYAHPSPSLTFPPNSDTCQILTSDWMISNEAANHNAGLQIRPPSDEGGCGTIMVMASSKKVSVWLREHLSHHHPAPESNKSSSLSRFICVVNFEKTIMVSMLSRSWSDLHQSSPLSGARIEDSVSRSDVDREMRRREVLAFVISGYLGSATLPCPGSVFMLRWFTRCHVSHVTLVTCNAEVSQQIFVLV